MTKSPHMSRREFVTITVAALGTIMAAIIGIPSIGFLLSPAVGRQKTDAWVSLGPLENYPLGEPTLFTFTRSTVNGWERTANSYGVYVYREDEEQVTTFSNLCTHLSCRVTWQEDELVYLCPCHDGLFDLDGKVTKGPPPRPLDQYENKVEDGNLFILLEQA